jgi:hypothetical protein
MKALSLWQPWATLMGLDDGKRYETRGWSTKFRGLLAIHAAKRFDLIQKEFCMQDPFFHILKAGGYSVDNLPLGAIVAVVKVVDVFKTEAAVKLVSKQEQAFGNYGTGRFAFQTELVKRFEKPIPMNGAQGFFDVADDLIMRFM